MNEFVQSLLSLCWIQSRNQLKTASLGALWDTCNSFVCLCAALPCTCIAPAAQRPRHGFSLRQTTPSDAGWLFLYLPLPFDSVTTGNMNRSWQTHFQKAGTRDLSFGRGLGQPSPETNSGIWLRVGRARARVWVRCTCVLLRGVAFLLLLVTLGDQWRPNLLCVWWPILLRYLLEI